MLVSLNLLFQLTPSSLWGEPLHISGLFATMLKNLLNEDDKVVRAASHYIHLLMIVAAISRFAHGVHLCVFAHCLCGQANVPPTDLCDFSGQWYHRDGHLGTPAGSMVDSGKPKSTLADYASLLTLTSLTTCQNQNIES